MRLANTEQSWGAPARLLHWALAGLVLFLIGLGLWMSYVVDDVLEQFRLVQIHKSWGFVVFVLALLRIVWRLMNRSAPTLPDHMSAVERTAAKAAHLALYALLIVMSVSGWLMASASPLQDQFGIKNMVFDWFELYDPFIPGDKAISGFFSRMHFFSAIALGLLVAAHAGAAIWHHVHHRDGVLKRMITG